MSKQIGKISSIADLDSSVKNLFRPELDKYGIDDAVASEIILSNNSVNLNFSSPRRVVI